ncbi:MAG: type IX secretion system membrane protein PorP/SprF [Bacteroidetes bacterium]|nr:type IX secretion system membrane protein PorP/SprF [Bacteroidota bacterium]
MNFKLTALIASVLLCILITGEAKAQDPQFTQFYANPLYLNPAFAGSAKCPRVQMNFRQQWVQLAPFITNSFSYDQHIDAISGGIGILALNDRAGGNTLNTTTISGIYSYELKVTREFTLKAGFQATYLQKSVDWNKLNFGDQIDPRRGKIYQTAEIPLGEDVKTIDFSAGVLGFTEQFYAGVALHHLTEPDEGLSKKFDGEKAKSILPRRLTIHAGMVIPLDDRSDDVSLSPNIMYMIQGAAQQFMLGMYANKGPMVGGLWYRHTNIRENGDAVAILLGLHHDIYRFGYSYDITVSRLSLANTFGSHEFSLGLQFYCKPKRKKIRIIRCPSF